MVPAWQKNQPAVSVEVMAAANCGKQ